MPIYEYKCTNCGDKIETLQGMNDAPRTHCDNCGQETLKKVIAPTSFVLKGSGWYVTDYPSSDRKKAMDSEKAQTSTGPDKGTDKGSEKKEAPQKSEPAVSKAP